MSHQCVKCSRPYPDDAPEALAGCICGAKAFFYIRDAVLPPSIDIPVEDRERMLRRVCVPGGHAPIIIDAEMIRVGDDGAFDLDIGALMRRNTIVYTHEEGSYSIDCGRLLRREK